MNGKCHGYVANAIKLINSNWSAARELNVNEKKRIRGKQKHESVSKKMLKEKQTHVSYLKHFGWT